jgi:hypothetical protein
MSIFGGLGSWGAKPPKIIALEIIRFANKLVSFESCLQCFFHLLFCC